MGLFSKLFGGAGSDKADKMRQMAIDAFNAIQSPELKDLQVQLSKYVASGRLTPEQAEAELLQSNAFNDIVTDPALAGAQKQALAALQEVGTSGGMTAIDKARLQDITNEQNTTARGRNEAVMSQARERGMGGSDINTVNQLLNEQAAADRASQRGTDVAAEAQARALQALIAGGQTASQIRGQEFSEGAAKAEAENAIDLFNKQTLNQTNLYNVDAKNRAEAANLANEQAISNANVNTTNTERTSNANARQQVFNNEMAKAGGKAGTYNAWANDATAANRSEIAADQALLGTAVGAGMTAFGGPAGAAAAGGMAANPGVDIGGGNTTNPAMTYDDIMKRKPGQVHAFSNGGEVEEDDKRLLTTEENPSAFNCGGKVHNYKQGGQVPGEAKVAGDSPENDTVRARLSPGELVVPRTVMSDDEEFDAFMEKFRPSRREKPANEDQPMVVRALQNLSSRVDRMEGR